MSLYEIREMDVEDLPELLRLMKAIVDFERGENFQLTEAELRTRGFGASPEFGTFVADNWTGQLGAMAVHYTIPFMHDLKPLLVLKWLYVDEAARGQKLGKRLMSRLCRYAIERGHHELIWHVLPDNLNAQRFYENLGGLPDPEWIRWKLPSEAIEALSRAT